MNKNQCKKYLKKAFYQLKKQNKEITPQSIEKQMKKEIDKDMYVYIAYGKMAIHNINFSANVVTAEELIAQIDVIEQLYDSEELIKLSRQML